MTHIQHTIVYICAQCAPYHSHTVCTCPNTHWYTYNTPSPTALCACVQTPTDWHTYNTPSPTALCARVQTPTDTHTTHNHRQHCVHVSKHPLIHIHMQHTITDSTVQVSKHPLADTWTPQTQRCDCPNTHRQMHNTTPQHPKHCVCVQTSSDRCMPSTMCVWKHPLTDACMQHLNIRITVCAWVCVCKHPLTDTWTPIAPCVQMPTMSVHKHNTLNTHITVCQTPIDRCINTTPQHLQCCVYVSKHPDKCMSTTQHPQHCVCPSTHWQVWHLTPNTQHFVLCIIISPTYTALRVYKHPLTSVRCMTPTHSILSCLSLSLQHPHLCVSKHPCTDKHEKRPTNTQSTGSFGALVHSVFSILMRFFSVLMEEPSYAPPKWFLENRNTTEMESCSFSKCP